MNLQIIDPTQYPGWDELLLTSSNYSFFHSSSWAKVLKETYGFSPYYFSVIDKGELLALIPFMEVHNIFVGRKGVSLPFTDFCEPIIDGKLSFSDIFTEIVAFAKNRHWKSIEFRGGSQFFSLRHAPCASRFALSPSPSRLAHYANIAPSYYHHIIDLTKGEKELFKNFRDSTRRNIKKAQSQGVIVELSTSKKAIDAFCHLNSLTRKRHGLPPQPPKFFKNFYKEIIFKNNGFIVVALYKGRTIASNIFCFLGKRAIYKYGASDLSFQNLRANNILMWESIKWFADKKYESLNLGRTETNNLGLRQFKAGWGAEETLLNYYRYDFKKKEFTMLNYDISAWKKWIFNKLPIPFLNFLGSFLYRYAA